MNIIESLAFELVTVTEAAAISSAEMVGFGDKHTADLYATQAMRKTMNELEIQGRIVIGEGERDEAPMLYIGEKVGKGIGPEVDIAVDPLEGTNLCASLNPNTICVLAAAERDGLTHAPDCYMDKLIVGPKSKGHVSMDKSVKENIEAIAKAEHIPVNKVIITVLERERHHKLINEIRDAGARVRTITDGDVMASVSAVMPHSIGHAVMGIGAAPEGVISATAMKILGGEMYGRFIYRDNEEKERLISMDVKDPDKVYPHDELVPGKDILFVATGVTSGDLLKGVSSDDSGTYTHTLLLNGSTGSIHYMENIHPIK